MNFPCQKRNNQKYFIFTFENSNLSWKRIMSHCTKLCYKRLNKYINVCLDVFSKEPKKLSNKENTNRRYVTGQKVTVTWYII